MALPVIPIVAALIVGAIGGVVVTIKMGCDINTPVRTAEKLVDMLPLFLAAGIVYFTVVRKT